MKASYPSFAILLVSACTTLAPAPSQVYQAAGAEAVWTFGGELKRTEGFFGPSFEVAITVDGETALAGGLSSTGNGELAGSYRGKPVHALCAGQSKYSWAASATYINRVNCTVLVANARAATLTFVP